jgi:hypothetical protein
MKAHVPICLVLGMSPKKAKSALDSQLKNGNQYEY